ncbi:MAG: alpha/beta hydrolase [Chloroflexi bacterium]|nr:alpha/beta hydrolase [Chloroflexota bacterium]
MNTHYLEYQGGKIAYDDSGPIGNGPVGSRPLVLCVPSLGDLRAEYRFLVPQLIAAGYRVVSMDVRGHGESSVRWPDYSVGAIGADMVALIRNLNAGPAVIIGTSMAAGAAVWAAAEAPELVTGLALIGPAVHGELSWQSRLIFAALFARPWGTALWLRYFTTLYPTRKPVDFDQYRAALRANLAQPGRLEALKQMIYASKSASEQRMPRVHAPTLVLMGSRDPDFKSPEAEARWVAEHLQGTYHMLPDAGHYPHAEMPELAGPLLLDFLQSLRQPLAANHARPHAA